MQQANSSNDMASSLHNTMFKRKDKGVLQTSGRRGIAALEAAPCLWLRYVKDVSNPLLSSHEPSFTHQLLGENWFSSFGLSEIRTRDPIPRTKLSLNI